jgi:hypothetical protein
MDAATVAKATVAKAGFGCETSFSATVAEAGFGCETSFSATVAICKSLDYATRHQIQTS